MSTDPTLKPARMIAIDGPAASGKSTVAEQIAHWLAYLFFDTGVMYRAVTFAAMDRLGAVDDEAKVTNLAGEIIIDVKEPSVQDGRNCDVLVDGVDVSWVIRSAQVEANVSQVSAYPGVRRELSRQQRRIGLRGSIVMVGRDIGTVVLPEADLKIYLDASVEVRAKRRYDEVVKRGGSSSYEDILVSMKRRDQIDSNRAVAPLRAADDAIVINTDALNADEVVKQIKSYIYR
jgi:cytidylate kinase